MNFQVSTLEDIDVVNNHMHTILLQIQHKMFVARYFQIFISIDRRFYLDFSHACPIITLSTFISYFDFGNFICKRSTISIASYWVN